MKDPLKTEETPYDILNLKPGASIEDINQAFARGLGSRNIQELTKAKKDLQDQEERFMLDFLHYDPQVLSRLDPNPLKNNGCLSPENRAATAVSWENLLKTNFSDMGIVHSLSVLLYWWAVYEEDRTFESMKAGEAQHDDSSSIPQVEQMWQKVIAYWVTMIGDLKSLNEGQALQGDLENKLRTKFKKTLSKHFHDRRESYRDNGNESLVQLYQKLDLDLKTELYTAKEVTSIGVRTGQGKICFGRLMLDQVGLLDLIRKTVHSQLQQSPERKDLRKLRDALSDYSSIAVLISNGKPEDALAIIHNLPGNAKRRNEVRELKARALMVRGRQQASLDNTNDALDAWGEALSTSKDEVIKGKITSEIVSTCQKRSAYLRQYQRDEAIDLLESGLDLVQDKELQLTLSDLLTKRGIEKINNAQDRANKSRTGVTSSLLNEMKEAVKDLERAAGLGSKQAKDQLQAAKNALKQAESGKGITKEIEALLKEANKAAEKKDWDTVINLYQKIMKKAGPSPPAQLKKNMAVFLTNRAIERVNQGSQSTKRVNQGSQSTHVLKLLDRKERKIYKRVLKNRNRSGCALCSIFSVSASLIVGNYSVSLPGGSTANICSNCISKFRQISDKLNMPGLEELSLYASAHNDLLEARKLDPTNQHIKRTLDDIENMFSKLPLDPRNEAVKTALEVIQKGTPTESITEPTQKKKTGPTRSLFYAGFLTLLLIGILIFGVLVFGLHRVHPIIDSFVRDRLPTELMGLIPLAYIVMGIILFKYFWQKICRRRWKHKNLFQRFVEVALYCSFLSICFVVLQSDMGIKTLYVSDWSKIGFLKRGYLTNKSHEPVGNSGIADSKITETNYSTKVTKKRTEVTYQARPAEALSNINSEHIEGGRLTEITDKLTQKKPQAKPEESKTNKILPVSKQRNGPTHYRVRTGDTLSHICSRHGLTLNELCRLNGIAADAVIYPGQKLIVRAAEKSFTP